MSDALRKARAYEAAAQTGISPAQRPGFHLSARVGWMNDPNGFSRYRDRYHLFYQYHPYDSHWGPMHWGHAVSRDLLHWDYLPCALAPDQPYDRDGCFSGSALELADGRHVLMYTGVRKETAPDGTERVLQTQCLAFGDGIDYEKYPGNPVLTAADLPEGGSPADFRDPRLLQLADGSFRCLVANDNRDGGGQILQYGSPDLIHWTLEGAVAKNHGRLGLMWECPDLFRLGGTDVLLISAQDMLPRGFEYHNGNGSLALLGQLDPETGAFREVADQALDYGIDFYAPQALLTPDGRRVMVGWLQNWDTCNQHFRSYPWFGQMSLPRELSVRNGRLCQRPLRELEALRGQPLRFERVRVENGSVSLPGLRGRMLELELTVTPVGPLYQRFALWFAQQDELHTGVSFRPYESVLKLDRKFSGSRRAIIHQRRCLVPDRKGEISMRVILDRFSVEVFLNGGEQVMSAVIMTEQDAREIAFHAIGDVEIDVVKYDLCLEDRL